MEEKFSKKDSESIDVFLTESYSKPPKKNYPTNKTDVNLIDNFWSLDILDLKDYGPENTRGYRYICILIDKFSKFGWTIPLEIENARTTKIS